MIFTVLKIVTKLSLVDHIIQKEVIQIEKIKVKIKILITKNIIQLNMFLSLDHTEHCKIIRKISKNIF